MASAASDEDATPDPTAANVLNDLTVVEYATEIAGPYCTKMFADAGATVIKVETGTGDPLRRHGTEREPHTDGALFRYLNAGKSSVVLDPADPRFIELLGGADLLVESLGSRAFDYTDIRARFPWLVVVAITPYGTTGPYRDRPATSFIAEAESGTMSTRGRLDQPPIQAGGRIFEWLTGNYAAVAALAAVRHARSTSEGELIDCSVMEVCHIGGSGGNELVHQLAGRPPITGPARVIELPSIEPTADGWIGFNTNTRQQFESFLMMIGRSDLLDEDESWAYAATRWARMEQWNDIVQSWTRQRTTSDILEMASLLRIPVAPVNDGRTVLDHPHFAARKVWAESPDKTFTHPLPPYKIDGVRPRPRGPAPDLGADQGRVEVKPRPERPSSPSKSTRPLAGVRIIDATAWWAGPSATQLLAALGADVIHLESTTHPDGGRMVVTGVDRARWWERSQLFLRTNTDKRDLTIDLSSPQGKAVMERLVARSDLIVENFSPRVFDSFGLSWEHVRAVNPRIIMVRMPAFGLDGPWRDHVGFAQTMEQVTGMAWVTGHEDDQPRIPRGPCDPMAGMSAAFAMLLGLARREHTGRGSFIESAMVEGALNAAAEQVVHYTAYGEVLSRSGNRSRDAAPQGLYASREPEEWLAVSVTSDEQWHALRDALGRPEWADDPTLDTLQGRRAAHDTIDHHLGEWARQRSVDEAVELLIDNGIPAGQVRDIRRTSTHPQLVAREFFEPLDHPVVGPLAAAGMPFRFASVNRWFRTASPTLGEHNDDILAELGLDAATIKDLAELGVIGTRPAGIDV